MAGDWLKVELNTPDKSEVHEIAAALEMTPDEAFGRVFRVWRWFDQNTENGQTRVTLASLDRHAGVTGFAQQMVEVGWLKVKENGTISVPNFERHNGKTAKTRALSAKRSQKYRHASVTTESRSPSRNERDQEKSIEKSKPPTPFGSPSLDHNTTTMNARWWLNNDTILAEAKRLSISTIGQSTDSLKAAIRTEHQKMPKAHSRTHARGNGTSQPPPLDPDQGHPIKPKGKFDDLPDSQEENHRSDT